MAGEGLTASANASPKTIWGSGLLSASEYVGPWPYEEAPAGMRPVGGCSSSFGT